MRKQVFNPSKGFFELRIVHWVGGLGLTLFAGAVGGYIWSASSLDRCWAPDCLNYFFIDLMKVPVGVLAFTAAMLALMATHHRSKQLAHQNTVSNYFTHLKEFREYWDAACKKGDFGARTRDSSLIYRDFFFKAKEGSLDVDNDYISEICALYRRLSNDIHYLEVSASKDETDATSALNERLDGVICSVLELGEKWGIESVSPRYEERNYCSEKFKIIMQGKLDSLAKADAIILAVECVIKFEPLFNDAEFVRRMEDWGASYNIARGNVRSS